MINADQALKLQAWVDGELPGPEAARLDQWVAADPEAAALAAELRTMRTLLRSTEPVRPLPHSREFNWAQIRRGIERLEPRSTARAAEQLPWWHWLWRPSAAFGLAAVLALAVLVASGVGRNAAHLAIAHEIETSVETSSPITFRSESERMTVVWISYEMR